MTLWNPSSKLNKCMVDNSIYPFKWKSRLVYYNRILSPNNKRSIIEKNGIWQAAKYFLKFTQGNMDVVNKLKISSNFQKLKSFFWGDGEEYIFFMCLDKHILKGLTSRYYPFCSCDKNLFWINTKILWSSYANWCWFFRTFFWINNHN